MANANDARPKSPTLRDVLELAKCRILLVVRDRRDDLSSDATRMSAKNGKNMIEQLEHSRVLAGMALLDGTRPELTIDCDPPDGAALVATVWPFDGPREERRG